MRFALVAGVFICVSCGRDETLNIYLVFPANVSANAVKSTSLTIEAAGNGTCEAPPSETPLVQLNQDGPPAAKGATSTELGKEKLPKGATLFLASVYDAAGGSTGTGNVLASGCTEAFNDPAKNMEVLIELVSHP